MILSDPTWVTDVTRLDFKYLRNIVTNPEGVEAMALVKFVT
jgi:hypothetical protein